MKDFIWYDDKGNRHLGKIAATSRTIIGWQNIEVPADPGTRPEDVITTSYCSGFVKKKVPIYDGTHINLFLIDDNDSENKQVLFPSEYVFLSNEVRFRITKGDKVIHYAQQIKVDGPLANFYSEEKM